MINSMNSQFNKYFTILKYKVWTIGNKDVFWMKKVNILQFSHLYIVIITKIYQNKFNYQIYGNRKNFKKIKRKIFMIFIYKMMKKSSLNV
jgi:hypothetical protein